MRRQSERREEWRLFVIGRMGNVSRTDFAERLRVEGASASSIYNWTKYGRVPARETIIEVADALHQDRNEWLEAAGLPPCLPEEVSEPSRPYGAPLSPAAPGPPPPEYTIRGQIHDSGAILAADAPPDWGMEPVDFLVETDSLQPDFRRGDRLTFRASTTARKGQVAVVSADGQERLVRYAGRTETGLLACSANAPDLRHPTELPSAVMLGVLTTRVSHYD